jgi:Cu+-exporting ATPase
MMVPPQLPLVGHVTTTVLINNIHCASCLSYINEVLNTLQPAPLSTTANYVSHEVTIVHFPELSADGISRALLDAAFEVQSVRTEDKFGNGIYEQDVAQAPQEWLEQAAQTLSKQASTLSWQQTTAHPELPSTKSQVSEKHVEHCVACQKSNGKTQLSKDVIVTIPEAGKFTATLSIAGMTCAACILSINEGVQELKFMEDISVSLLTNSATVTFAGPKENIDQIVERIEDRGYGCHVENIVEVGGVQVDNEQAERTVMVKIAGMFGDHCPQRIGEALSSSFPGLLVIDRPPSHEDPIMTITYQPKHRIVTIRDIVATIHGVNDQIEATIYHPPTIEERSQAMQRRERRRLLLRLLLSFIVAIPTFLISVVWMSLSPSTNRVRIFFQGKMWAGVDSRAEWALFFLATPVMFFAADVFHVRAIKEIRALWGGNSKVPVLRRFYRFGSMNLLMSAGTSVAYFPSIAVLALNSRKTGQIKGQTTTYFDAVVFLTMFILAGRYLEAYSKAQTGDAVMMLGRLRPTEAMLVRPNLDIEDTSQDIQLSSPVTNVEKINVDLLEVGDIVRVLHGASPPADGIVISGNCTFDESSLTGESRPITKIPGDKVFAGTVNTGKPVSIKVTEISGASMLDQIVKVVREGQTKRAPVERVADILTGYFVPVITFLAITTFFTWFGLGQGGVLSESWRDVDTGGWAFWALQFAIAVFVGACPCGIALAAPTALFVGSGLAAQHGILVKGGGEAFQEASALDVVVFDKTGTLTEGGNPSVTHYDIVASSIEEMKVIWAIAQALEESSSHPIAKAITALCSEQTFAPATNSTVEELPGRGLKGTFMINNTQYEAAIGNEIFVSSLGTAIDICWSNNASTWKASGESIALLTLRPLSLSGEEHPAFKLVAQFATTDSLRPEASLVLSALRKQGLSIWMISGDNATTAMVVGSQLGIPTTNIIAGVLPSEKADKIRWLQSSAIKRNGKAGRAIVAMVGDGINDSPALTAADAGIAIGSGSDVAISSAKFVLVSSNLYSLLTLISLSRTVFRRVKFNFGWALVYNLVLLPIAAGVIYPISGHPRLNPVWASLAMAMSSLSVICSSLAMRTGIPVVGFRAASKTEQRGG